MKHDRIIKVGRNLEILMDLPDPIYRGEWERRTRKDPKIFDKQIEDLISLELVKQGRKDGRKQYWQLTEKGIAVFTLTMEYEHQLSRIYGEPLPKIFNPPEYDILIEMIQSDDSDTRNQACKSLMRYYANNKLYPDDDAVQLLKQQLTLHPLSENTWVFQCLHSAVESVNRHGVEIVTPILTDDLLTLVKDVVINYGTAGTTSFDTVLSFVGMLSEDEYLRFVKMIVEEISDEAYQAINNRLGGDLKGLFFLRPDLKRPTLQYLKNTLDHSDKEKDKKIRQRAFGFMENISSTY